jgi:hypothetical protein
MKKLLIPLLILLSVSACDIEVFGTPEEYPFQYKFENYAIFNNPAEVNMDTIIIIPNLYNEFTDGQKPRFFDEKRFLVSLDSGYRVLNLDTEKYQNNIQYIKSDTIKIILQQYKNTPLSVFVSNDLDDVLIYSLPSIILEPKNHD